MGWRGRGQRPGTTGARPIQPRTTHRDGTCIRPGRGIAGGKEGKRIRRFLSPHATRSPLALPGSKLFLVTPTMNPSLFHEDTEFRLCLQQNSCGRVLSSILESPTRTEDWEECKFDILHVARLCSRFVGEAKRAALIDGEQENEKKRRRRKGGMSRTWRCATFDRTLIRYYR